MKIESCVWMGVITRSVADGVADAVADAEGASQLQSHSRMRTRSRTRADESRKRRRVGSGPIDPMMAASVEKHWTTRSWLGLLRACCYVCVLAVMLFFVHHKLQMVYFQTCKANLITVVLHDRSDVCHGLNMIITSIENGYQHGMRAIMQYAASVAALFVPSYLFTSARASWWKAPSLIRTGRLSGILGNLSVEAE